MRTTRAAGAHFYVNFAFTLPLTPAHAACVHNHSYPALTLPKAEILETFLTKHCATTRIAKTTPGFRIYGSDCCFQQAAITNIVPDGEETSARRTMTIMHGCATVQSSGPNHGFMIIEGNDCRR